MKQQTIIYKYNEKATMTDRFYPQKGVSPLPAKNGRFPSGRVVPLRGDLAGPSHGTLPAKGAEPSLR